MAARQLGGIVGSGDGPADDEVIGSGADGVLRGDDAGLVGGDRSGGTDAGGDQGESGAKRLAQADGFLGGGDDAAASGVDGQCGKAENLGFDAAADADFLQIGGGERGENGDG